MRFGWLEIVCVVAIGVATLQLPVAERGARLFTPPTLTLPVPLKTSLANVVARDTAQPPVRTSGRERN